MYLTTQNMQVLFVKILVISEGILYVFTFSGALKPLFNTTNSNQNILF